MRSRGHLIRQMARMVRALNVDKAITVNEMALEAGVHLRQAYRWLHALQDEGMVDEFDFHPSRFRLRKPGVQLIRRKGETTSIERFTSPLGQSHREAGSPP